MRFSNVPADGEPPWPDRVMRRPMLIFLGSLFLCVRCRGPLALTSHSSRERAALKTLGRSIVRTLIARLV